MAQVRLKGRMGRGSWAGETPDRRTHRRLFRAGPSLLSRVPAATEVNRDAGMLSLPRASRLTRRAGRRGWLSGRAWRRLAEAVGHGDEVAIEAAWQAWLRNPDYERWRQLSRWRTAAPGSVAEPLLALLRVCLEYRLGADVSIAAAAAPGAPDDIALAERPRQGGHPGC